MIGLGDSFARAQSAYDRMEPNERYISDDEVIKRAEFLMEKGEACDPFNEVNFLDALDVYFRKHPASAEAMMNQLRRGELSPAMDMRDITVSYARQEAMAMAQRQLENGD